jgi:crotonobetainyl-CoA:carnitine CoA-transferase CaiB-like acyl-CoA transferase
MFFQAGDFIFYDGKAPDVRGGPLLRGTSPLYRMYRARDGWLFVDARSPESYTSICMVLGLESPVMNYEAVAGLRAEEGPATAAFAAAFERDTRERWLAALRAAGVVAVPVLEPLRLLDDEQFRVTIGVDERIHPEVGFVRQYGPLVRPSLTPAAAQRTAPLLGEHTREVLAEAGLSDAEVGELIESGAAWGL